MRPLLVVARDEGIEARLLLQHIVRGRLGRFALQREVHPLVPTVLLWMAWLDPFDLNAQAEPPDGEFAEPVEGRRSRKGHPVVGANGRREAELFERALEHDKGESPLRARQRFADEQIARREI